MSIGLWMTAREKAELWRRWKAGETVATMARAMGRRESTLLAAVRKNGARGNHGASGSVPPYSG